MMDKVFTVFAVVFMNTVEWLDKHNVSMLDWFYGNQ